MGKGEMQSLSTRLLRAELKGMGALILVSVDGYCVGGVYRCDTAVC